MANCRLTNAVGFIDGAHMGTHLSRRLPIWKWKVATVWLQVAKGKNSRQQKNMKIKDVLIKLIVFQDQICHRSTGGKSGSFLWIKVFGMILNIL